MLERAGKVLKVKMFPPFVVVGTITAALVEEMTKSDAKPVVAPVAPFT